MIKNSWGRLIIIKTHHVSDAGALVRHSPLAVLLIYLKTRLNFKIKVIRYIRLHLKGSITTSVVDPWHFGTDLDLHH